MGQKINWFDWVNNYKRKKNIRAKDYEIRALIKCANCQNRAVRHWVCQENLINCYNEKTNKCTAYKPKSKGVTQ